MKYMQKQKTYYDKLENEYHKVKITCRCGHKEVIPVWEDKHLCSWCGNYVYRNKQLEFKEKLKKELKKNGN